MTAHPVILRAGDLQQYPEEISGLFTKCLSQLSVQIPTLASLLALIHAQEPQFAGLVADKLQQRLLQAAAEDDVPTAKLVLRSVACLAASGCFAAEGSGGLLELLQDLLAVLTTGRHRPCRLTYSGSPLIAVIVAFWYLA
jgi:hypothetical protein